MNRLMEKTVFSGFVIAWRRATCPTSRSPSLANATTDGVVRPPSEFGMTVGSPPSMTATTELVVPRSIPMILPIFVSSLSVTGAYPAVAFKSPLRSSRGRGMSKVTGLLWARCVPEGGPEMTAFETEVCHFGRLLPVEAAQFCHFGRFSGLGTLRPGWRFEVADSPVGARHGSRI